MCLFITIKMNLWEKNRILLLLLCTLTTPMIWKVTEHTGPMVIYTECRICNHLYRALTINRVLTHKNS